MAFIEAREVDLRGLLSNASEAYKVPPYQRPYAWDREQWEDLFEDIASLKEGEVHFLGSIVVISGGHRLGINYFELVDGQQRLATLLVLLAVIRDISNELGMVNISNHINSTLLFASDWETTVPKLQLGELDQGIFEYIIKGKVDRINEDTLIYKCYKFFYSRIRERFGDNLKEGIKTLFDKLMSQVSIIHINAKDEYNAFRLFETLNDRGLELSAVDLIKNDLLRRVSKNRELFDELVATWNEMYDKVRDLEPVKFLRRYVLANFSGKTSENRLYERIRDIVEKGRWSEEKIISFVKELNSSATIYRKIYNSQFNSNKINNKLRELQLVEVSPSYTLLLKIMSLYEGDILGENDVLRIMNMIETFHIRWGVCEQSTSKLDQIYNNICIEIDNSSEDPKEITKVIWRLMSREVKNAVDDEIFRRSFSRRRFKPSETRTKYILWKLSRPTGETMLHISNVHIEHILPRKLSKGWVTYLRKLTGKLEEEIKALHGEYLNRIGNLTIILGEWNTSISNRSFNEKKAYYEKSGLEITRNLAKYNNWSFKEIDMRSEKLAELALEIWKWDENKYLGDWHGKKTTHHASKLQKKARH
jgi:uncharacterized protein with ParB-like and HNH nuclease domain